VPNRCRARLLCAADGTSGPRDVDGALVRTLIADADQLLRAAIANKRLVHCPESSMPTLGSVPSGAWEDGDGVKPGVTDG
jgi:hypothetical protein